MSIEQILLLDFEELRYLVLACPEIDCHTEVVIDASDTTNGIPNQCPSCREAFDKDLRERLALYKNLYVAWSKGKQVRVRTVFKNTD